MVCNHCGAPLEPGMRVCPHCGYTSDSDGTSKERTAPHRPLDGRANTRNRNAFMAATSSSQQQVDRATAVRADGNPCLYCGAIIPDNAISCPKCGKSVSGKAPSISGAMPPVPKTPRQAYEARTGQNNTRASVAAKAAYAAMAQKMGYDTSPRQITGEIPPVPQTSGKIPPVSQNSGKIPTIENPSGAFPAVSQGSGKITPLTQNSGKIPTVNDPSGAFSAISQGSGKIPTVSQGSGTFPPVSQTSGKIPPVGAATASVSEAHSSQESNTPNAAITAPLTEPITENNNGANTDSSSENQAAITAVLPPLTAQGESSDISSQVATNDAVHNSSTQTAPDKNPYTGAHAKPATPGSNTAKKHPTKAKAPLSTTRTETIGVATITSRDLTNEEKRSKHKSALGIGIIACVLAAGVGIGAWWFNGGDEKQRLVEYIETLGAFNTPDDASDDTSSPFAPNSHSNTGGTNTKQVDDNTKDTTKDSDNTTKSSKTSTTKTSDDDKDDASKTTSDKKPTVTDTTKNNTTTSNSNKNNTSSTTNSNNSSNAGSTTYPSNNNYNNTGNSGSNNSSNSSANNGSNQGSSIWPDDLNNPPYQYNPPTPGNSGSWGSNNSGTWGGNGSWGGNNSWGGNSSWNGGSGGNGSYIPPLSDLETEADKELRRELDKAKARVEDYILPESNDRDYLREELNKLTDFELYLARNEIYARHGRIFNVAALDEYFNSRKWYFGKYTGVVFDTMVNVLNEFEIRNAELIKEIERERNSPYLSE